MQDRWLLTSSSKKRGAMGQRGSVCMATMCPWPKVQLRRERCLSPLLSEESSFCFLLLVPSSEVGQMLPAEHSTTSTSLLLGATH